MVVRETLARLEELVLKATRVPFTGKILIEDDEIMHLVEELRHDLPQELERADKIIQDREEILKSAQAQADGRRTGTPIKFSTNSLRTSTTLFKECRRLSQFWIRRGKFYVNLNSK